MSGLFTDGLVIPAAVLALLGWLVPRMLSLVFPEGVKPLFILSFVATLIMFVLGMGFFLAQHEHDKCCCKSKHKQWLDAFWKNQ